MLRFLWAIKLILWPSDELIGPRALCGKDEYDVISVLLCLYSDMSHGSALKFTEKKHSEPESY